MNPLSVYVDKVTLIIAGGRNRHILQRQPNRHIVVGTWIFDTHYPWAAKAVAKYPTVAPCGNMRVFNSMFAHQRHRSINRITFGDAAQVEIYVGSAEI